MMQGGRSRHTVGPLRGNAAPFGPTLGAGLGLVIGSFISQRQRGQHDQA